MIEDKGLFAFLYMWIFSFLKIAVMEIIPSVEVKWTRVEFLFPQNPKIVFNYFLKLGKDSKKYDKECIYLFPINYRLSSLC